MMLHSRSVFPLAVACDTMQNKCFYSIYRAVFEYVLHSHFIVHLYTAAAAAEDDASDADAIITFKAVSENVRNCILFLSACILKQT